MANGTCSARECERKSYARGVCRPHYFRLRKWGDIREDLPLRDWPKKRSPLDLLMEKVDQTDECWHWTAAKDAKGYGRFNYDGIVRFAHRVSYELHVGSLADSDILDHICRNTSCVRPEHLRIVTVKQNSENLEGSGRNGLGRGVIRYGSRFQAVVKHDGRQHWGGTYATAAEAATAAREVRLKLYTHNEADRVS